MQSGIYAITSPSGRRYIGSAVNIKRRWWTHRTQLRSGSHHCAALQRAFSKYGEAALTFSVLERVEVENLLATEQRYIDATPLKKRYNSLPTAGSHLGAKRSAASRERYRRAALSRSPEVLAKIGQAHKGKTLSDAHIVAIREAGKRVENVERLNRMNAARIGMKQSPEHIEKRMAQLRGRKGRAHSLEARARMSEQRKGRVHTEETRAKMRAAHAARKAASGQR